MLVLVTALVATAFLRATRVSDMADHGRQRNPARFLERRRAPFLVFGQPAGRPSILFREGRNGPVMQTVFTERIGANHFATLRAPRAYRSQCLSATLRNRGA